MSAINTNINSLYTQNALRSTERNLSVAMQQLATGKRINSARDDAAGLAISARMTQQIRSLNMAVKNAGDAISLIQTAEGATATITDMLQRMRELAVQSANDTNAANQRGYLDLEFQQLKQQIQTIADQTQWNGFSILNGTAGDPVGERPVYKATSMATAVTTVQYASQTPLASDDDNQIAAEFEDLGNDVTAQFSKSGTLSVSFKTDSGSVVIDKALFTLDDGRQITLDASDNTIIELADNVVTLKAASGLVTGDVTLTQTLKADDSDVDFAATESLEMRVLRDFGSQESLMANDLQINGVNNIVPQSLASSDPFSPSGNAAASAIARAAAINTISGVTGVSAVVNPNVMSGAAMSGTEVVTGSITINGFTTPLVDTTLNNSRQTRADVVSAINAISAQTGVIAINTNADNTGIRLIAQDGRNIEVGFNTESTAAEFSARTGLKEGLQIGTYSLETASEAPIVITSGGDWQRAGLQPGNYSENISVVATAPRPVVEDAADIQNLGDGDLVINGIAIRGTRTGDDTLSSTAAATSSRTASAIAIASAINASEADTGVKAVALPAVASATAAPPDLLAYSGTATFYINGIAIQLHQVDAEHDYTLSSDDTPSQRLDKIIGAINIAQGQTGAEASMVNGKLQISTFDGRNLSIWYDSATGIDADELGLTGMKASDITGASADSTEAVTIYGGISLESSKPITLSAGVNGFSTEGDFSSLGFQEGTFGGVVDDPTSKLTPPRTGRLSFHVGASANQTISIDLADYGSKGPITSEITGDLDISNTDARVNRIDSATSAAEMLGKLDTVLDRVNADRARMGAVMNRLDYVISNLSNVSTNTEASRSQIEDADYAKASTDLAKTQIMQQAATAVLAQANQSLQNVLKLLQ